MTNKEERLNVSKSRLTNIYFSHDRDTRADDKISDMIFKFRKYVKGLERSDIEELAGISCYGVFWSILEYMHRNGFHDKDIDILADNLRIKPEFIKKVLNDFGLFQHLENEFISERLQKDIELQNEKSKKAKRAAEARYAVSDYAKAYQSEFGIKPVLDDNEIKTLLKFCRSVENYKEIIPDILYTLKSIKFTNGIAFDPKTNWLLKDNNLARVYHGEFGALKHRKTAQELKEEEAKKKAEEEKLKKPDEIETAVKAVKNKDEAFQLILKYSKYSESLGVIVHPHFKELMQRYEIAKKDIEQRLKSCRQDAEIEASKADGLDDAIAAISGKAAAADFIKKRIKQNGAQSFNQLPQSLKNLMKKFDIRAKDLIDASVRNKAGP